jgi:hypothetical protein
VIVRGKEHTVGAVRAGRLGREPRRSQPNGMDLATELIRQHPPGRQDFERDPLQHAVALLEHHEHVRHQSTFASVRSASMRAGTASAPSPTIRPAFRSGGYARSITSRPMGGRAAGFTSSGFFLAAMIPLSAG